MREIKFRVYVEFKINGVLHKEMAGPENWYLMTQTGQLMAHGPLEGPHFLEKEYTVRIPLFWTGLLDKNGKEIYWFDILKYFDEENRKHLLIIGENENIINAYRELEMALYYSAYIVGNKFENPELLEDK